MNRRFLTNMMIVIGIAGLVWLGVALVNYRRGGDFDWGGIVLFAIAMLALSMARGGRSRPS